MKKIDKLDKQPISPDQMMDELAKLEDKLNEVIEVVNELTEIHLSRTSIKWEEDEKDE